MRKRVVVILVVVVLILVGAYFIYFASAGIDDEKEVIAFARSDESVRNFITEVDGSGVMYSAYYDDSLGVWNVVVYSKDESDLTYGISFTSDRKIVSRG